MRKSNREVNGEKVFRYSIRKYHFGAASVAVAALMFFANGAVKADTLPVSPATANTEKVNVGVTELTEGVTLEKSLEAEGNKEIVAPEPAEETSNKKDGAGSSAQGAKEIKVSDKAVIPANQTEEINKAETNGKEKEVITNKDKLESLLKEIDQLNLKDYTEDSVKVLQEKVAKAKEVLVNATTQKEIDSAYNELVAYKNSGLKRVPKLKENVTPKPDTTNGKETLGKKAENTELNATNIAGHNHSLNGTSLPEGSGFRAAPNNANFRYETSGSDLSSLVAGEELGYGKKVIIKVRYDKTVISSRDINITTTPNTGPRIEYTNKYSDGIAPYDGGTNVKLVGTIPNDMIGTYDLHVHILNNKNSNSEITTLKIPITVKPKKPTVSVDDLANAEGKKPVVTARVANTSISKVEFYLNGQQQTVVNATNGQATWTPTTALRENDRITVKNIAKGGIPSVDAYGNTFTINEVESDMSDAVVIPKAPKPAFDLSAEKSNAKAELGRIAQAEINAINGDKSLTTTEKTAKVQEVNTKKTQGEQAIDAASVNDADKVAQAKETAKTAIEGVHTAGDLNAVKNAAKAELATAAAAEKAEIAGDKSLTAAQRAEKEKSVDTTKAAEEAKITAADDADKVEAAKTAGVAAIKAVHTAGDLNAVKNAEKADLATAVAEEKAEIAGDKSLTAAQRAEKEKSVDTTKAAEEAKITAADDADKVEAAKTAGVAAIKAVHTAGDLNAVKNAAKASLESAAAEEKAEIAGDKSLTAVQRTEKEKAVDTTKAEEEAKITATDDADKVATAKTAGVAAIKAVHTVGSLDDVKAAAKAELATAAAEEKAEIAGDKSLTAVQRTEKEKAVDTTKAEEEAKITATDDADKVATAKTAGVTAIKAVHTVGSLDDVKAAAKASLESAAAAEKAEIAGDKSLTAA